MKHKIFIVIFSSAVMFFINLFTVNVNAAENEAVTRKIDKFVQKFIVDNNIPGASIGIVKDDKIMYLKGYGRADNRGRAVTERTPFVLGSLSKSFTALAVMELSEQGKVNIDAPVKSYLPWFKIKDAAASEKITVRDLLNHKSGLTGLKNYRELTHDDVPLEDFVRSFKDAELTKPVGEAFQYSNIGYDILGDIVEKVSGVPYGEYIEKNIFAPLDMKNSFTSMDEAEKNGLSAGYYSYFGYMLKTSQRKHTGNSPAGFLVSTSEDMCHYLIAQMNGGRYENNVLASDKSTALMQSQAVSTNMYGSYWKYYGMGWFNNGDGIVWHNGGTENFVTELWMDKKSHFGVVVLFNACDYSSDYDSVPKGILSILQGKNPSASCSVVTPRRVVQGLLGVVILLCIFAVYKTFKWKAVYSKSAVAVLILFNFILPAAAIYYIPKTVCRVIFDGPVSYLPDIFILTALFPVVMILTGIFKAARITLGKRR